MSNIPIQYHFHCLSLVHVLQFSTFAQAPMPAATLEHAPVLVASLQPSEEQVAQLPPMPMLPRSDLDPSLWPGGCMHCGGDLAFPNLTLCDPALGFKMPLFMMAPGAVAAFPGSDLCHGTTEHHAEAERAGGCKAHISFAVQTPQALLGISRDMDREPLHSELLQAGHEDALALEGAIWLPVWHFQQEEPPTCKLTYSKEYMYSLLWRKVVLFDVRTGRALVIYDSSGGMSKRMALRVSHHFGFMHKNWKFTSLDRHASASSRSGCLHLDKRGTQRMEMLGLHGRGRNIKRLLRVLRTRPTAPYEFKNKVVNRRGDLEAYAVHFRPALGSMRFNPQRLKGFWSHLSSKMHALLPSACNAMASALCAASVLERCCSHLAQFVTSPDLLVNNVGVSAAYQSPPHFDGRDMGWTFAFASKCCSRMKSQ